MKDWVQKHGFPQGECRPARAARGLLPLACVVLPLACVIFFAPQATATPGELEFVEAEFDGVGGVNGLNGVQDLTVSPGGAHVYVAGFQDSALAVFSRSSSTGELTFVEAQVHGVGGVAGLDAPLDTAVSPDGAHVYATGHSVDSVAVFSRNASTGKLTFVEAQFDNMAGVDGLEGASDIAVSPDGAHVYVTGRSDNAVVVFSRNSSTGELTFVEAHSDDVVAGLTFPSDIVISADGAHVYVTGKWDGAVVVFSRNSSTGELTFVETQFDGVGGVDGLSAASGIALSPDGAYTYVCGELDDAVAVFSRNSSTGELSFVQAVHDGAGGVDGLGGSRRAVASPDGAYLYVTGGDDHAVAVFLRDVGTGELAFLEAEFDNVNGVDGLHQARGVAVSPDGAYVYVAGFWDNAVAVFWRDNRVPTTSLFGLAVMALALLSLGVRRRC